MRILVTGGQGFLGSYLVRILEGSGHHVWAPVSSEKLLGDRKNDLTDPETAFSLIESFKPEIVYHCAGWNGSIEFSRLYGPRIFQANTQMALNVLEASHYLGVKRVFVMLASCAYPDSPFGDCVPSRFLSGAPHPTVACHGYAKRNAFIAAQLWREKGLDAVCICPPTLMGPGDRTDPLRSKFPMAMVKRFVDAADSGADRVECWGDGTPLREIMYVGDCANLLAGMLTRSWTRNGPLNFPSPHEVSVGDFAEMAADAAGFEGTIFWKGGESGQRRKKLDDCGFSELFPKFAHTSLTWTVRRTVEWYREQKADRDGAKRAKPAERSDA